MNDILLAAQPVVRVYAEPSLEAEVTSQIRYGWSAEVLAQYADWVYLRMHDSYQAWALRQDFVPQTERPLLLQIVSLSANLYLDPDVKRRAPLLNIPFESRLELLSDLDGQWLQIRLLDGQTAFLLRGDSSLSPAPVTMQQALDQASRLLGITYTWGGTSTYGFDCSGFVQMVFRQAGLTLPRDARAQCHWSGFQTVRRDALRCGDVLFFSETGSVADVNHVALHLGDPDGTPGRFLHDTTTEPHPGVQFSHLDHEPWRTRLVACRRIKELSP